jgi:hypothetical protein
MPRTLKLVDADSKPLEDFDWFWSEYPRKKSKGDAFKAWQQTASIRPHTEEIIAAIDRNLSTGHWDESKLQYVPYAATWLRAWGWADE